jgi:uncharacterized protein (DUF433 family)
MKQYKYTPEFIHSQSIIREYPHLFRDLIMNASTYFKDVQPPMGELLARMKQAPELDGFTDEEFMGIMFKMQIFQLGLSVMDVYGMLPEGMSEEKLIELMEMTGKDIIAGTRLRKKGVLE